MKARSGLCLVVVVTCALLVAACGGSGGSQSAGSGGSQSAGSSTKLPLGFITDETGQEASIGTGYLQGAETETSVWNSSHTDKIVLTPCDSQSTGPGASDCYLRLKNTEIGIAGPSLYLGLAAVHQVASEGSVPVVSGAPLVDPQANTSLFQTIPTVKDGVAAAFNYFKSRGFQRIATLTSNDQPGGLAKSAVAALAPADHLSLVSTQTFDPAGQNYSGQAANIANAHPQAVLAWTAGPQIITALRALSAAGVNVPVMLNYVSMSTPLLTKAGSAAGNNLLFFATTAFTSAAITQKSWRARVATFATAYKDKYGTAPDLTAFDAADTVLLLAEAASNTSGHPTAASTKGALTNGHPLDGLMFRTFTFSPTRHIGVQGSSSFTILNWQPAQKAWTVAPKQ